jgi:hypothetical protein
MPTQNDPRGRVLKVTRNLDGYSQVKVDNGPVKTITIHCLTEQLGDLLSTDMDKLRTHLLTRQPGHFRRKPGLGS